ncbi:hypothetical protein FHS36_006653 [Streptomyces eurocidicus]|uniref:Thioesterase domain-containing protein n=1 Tax=Streptomyces eurocidicus TaxID=66423 RepID=A0A7W8BGU1_STREU|nr:thioesterase domain-containing protein [Streptomyces eurocidicus]MBB5123174.1 hypothetical protein [Streptomyces eurocidicus]
MHALRRARPGVRLINVFGQSESIACSFLELPDPFPDDLRQVPVGPAYPGAEMLVLDEAGCAVGTGGVGELFLRSTALFCGYWQDPDATRRALVPLPGRPRCGERVLRTGDLLRREPGGLFSFAGRRDLQVKVGGNRVEPEEIEAHLTAHPKVEEALIVPVGGDLSTRLVALVACGMEAAGLEDESHAWCGARLPSYMTPAYVLTVPALPRTVGGKLDRQAAHDIALRRVAVARDGAAYAPARPAAGPLRPRKQPPAGHPLAEPLGSPVPHVTARKQLGTGSWATAAPEGVQIAAVRLPGRDNRLSEPPLRSAQSVAEMLGPALAGRDDSVPWGFFGHSLGALLAFETAHWLTQRGHPGPRVLVVASAPAPHLPYSAPPLHQLRRQPAGAGVRVDHPCEQYLTQWKGQTVRSTWSFHIDAAGRPDRATAANLTAGMATVRALPPHPPTVVSGPGLRR